MNERTLLKKQPIRRPRHKHKNKLKHHRNLARTVGSRMFVWNGNLFPVTRAPEIAVLMDKMVKLSVDSISMDSNLLADIAFAGAADGQLTKELLTRISHSIKAWQEHLDANPRNKGLNKERAETARLRERADACFAILNHRRPPEGDCFLLVASQQAEFADLIKGHPCSPLQRKLAEIVYWFSGRRAAERFLTATLDQAVTDEIKFADIDKIIDWLELLTRLTSVVGARATCAQFRNNDRFKNLMKWMGARPFKWPKSKGTTLEKIAQYIDRLKGFKKFLVDTVEREFPLVLAVWSICDLGTEDLPIEQIRSARRSHNVERLKTRALQFCEASKGPGYDRWLKLINSGQLTSKMDENVGILALLNRHKNVDDVLAVARATDPTLIGADVNLSVAKHLSVQYRRYLKTSENYLPGFARYVKSNKTVSLGLALFSWLNRFPEKVQTIKEQKLIQRLSIQAIKLMEQDEFSESLLAKIKSWSDVKQATREPIEDETNWPSEVRGWLRRTQYYQKLGHRKAQLPKTFREQADFFAKRENEIRFLKSKQQDGSITQGQSERLSYLRQLLDTQHASDTEDEQTKRLSDSARKVRDAQAACLRNGLSTLIEIISETAKEIWLHYAGVKAGHWSRGRQIEMAKWICEMNPGDRQLLRQIVDSRETYGRQYKRGLAFNTAWMFKALRHGIKLTNWLNPEPRWVELNGIRIKLEVELDPIEVFFMGTYFNTCLAQGGCNEMSVLANAAHVNKQVIYARTEDGALLGRQLIAINKSMKLVGYHCYVNADRVWEKSDQDAPEYKQVAAEFARFAARIANDARVEVELHDAPDDPEILGGHFWYDDGVHEWDPAIVDEQKQISVEQYSTIEFVHSGSAFLPKFTFVTTA